MDPPSFISNAAMRIAYVKAFNKVYDLFQRVESLGIRLDTLARSRTNSCRSAMQAANVDPTILHWPFFRNQALSAIGDFESVVQNICETQPELASMPCQSLVRDKLEIVDGLMIPVRQVHDAPDMNILMDDVFMLVNIAMSQNLATQGVPPQEY
ncbi:hypothetical protein MKZ38_010384 [Zalerion maritima]|uniref:Uncharacterized protein n=1 Tax=Zalerion maritima TaxID=339359 RepID=A0AAD5RU11_9PEZI|nr:hypothetical protein MKZ38_010384 [Zalerion maritima]